MSTSNRLRILSVGGNAVSAFLSWRLQATLACDVTLVWKSGFDSVSQYGISFRSKAFGNERFKPRQVVRSPEEAVGPPGFDYVLLCVKALPDVYDLAAVIESVVTPQLTCIILNTTNSLGVEPYLESRFPTNVVLSICSGVSITQLGPSEFEHIDSSEVWVGSANQNPNIPITVQGDMAEALALTLQSGGVDCHVSANIRQQQWEKMIGPIAFHPLSVLLETPSHTSLIEKPGVKSLVSDLIDELMEVAEGQDCSFPKGFKQNVTENMLRPSATQSTMYQDFQARRPMEVETFLGSPIKMAENIGLKVPRIQTLYPLLHHLNISNQAKPPSPTVSNVALPARTGGNNPALPSNQFRSGPVTAPGVNGRSAVPKNGNGLPQSQRRPPPGLNPRLNAHNGSRRNSFDNDLEEFGHIAMYGDILHTDDTDDLMVASMDGRGGAVDMDVATSGAGSISFENLSLRERELQIKQKELALREQELALHRAAQGLRRKSGNQSVYDDEEDDTDGDLDEYCGPALPQIDPDNFDMMSVTSKRNRRLPGAGNQRNNPDRLAFTNRSSFGQMQMRQKNRDRTSARLISNIPSLHASITDDPLMGYSSNRYGTVDRKTLSESSRANSMTAQRFEDIRGDPAFASLSGGASYPAGPGMNRRISASPGDSRMNMYGPRNSFSPPNSQTHRTQQPDPNVSPLPLIQPKPKYPTGNLIPQVD